MKKLNAFLDCNIINIISVFLLIQPILDVFTAMSVRYSSAFFSIGMIMRALFILAIIYYTIFISNFKYRKFSIYYFLIVFIYMAIFLGVTINIKGLNLIFGEIKWLIKTFYFPILLVGFINVFGAQKEKIKSPIFISILASYVFIIIMCQLFGIESEAYTQGKVGYIGIFYSANEISGIISILLPFLFFYSFSNKHWLIKLIIVLATLYCSLITGTKTSFLSFVIVSITFLISYIVRLVKAKKYKYIKIILFSSIVVITLVSIILPYTAFGKNIIKHTSFLKIDNINEIFEGDNFNRLIYSDRLTFLRGTQIIYDKADINQKIMGIGYSFNDDQKIIEIDYYDIYYRYGPIGFVIYFIPLIWAIFFITKHIKENNDIYKLVYIVSITLGLALAFFTGHIFTAPSVSIYMSLLIAMLSTKNKDDFEKLLKYDIIGCKEVD